MVWFKYAQSKKRVPKLAGHAHVIAYMIHTLKIYVCSANYLTYLMNMAKINLCSGDASLLVDEVGSGQRAAVELSFDRVTMSNALEVESTSQSCGVETALLTAKIPSLETLVP